MASHYRWYSSEEATTVPFNAVYNYPSQSNQATKSIPRISPKNKNRFSPGDEIQIDLPATGYMNASKSMMFWDVVLTYTVAPQSGGKDTDFSIIRFQNNIQSLIQDLRILYGSSPLEEIRNYGLLVRLQTEWTATCQLGTMDQTSILEGIGGITWGVTADGSVNLTTDSELQSVRPSMVNVRQNFIHGISLQSDPKHYLQSDPAALPLAAQTEFAKMMMKGGGCHAVPVNNQGDNFITAGESLEIPRRYGFQLMAGLFNQGKLIPLKYMASQLQISITLAQAEEVIYWQKPWRMTDETTWVQTTTTSTPSYYVENVTFVPELLEFNPSYDAAFLEGLQKGGIPIKFSSFNTFQFSSSGSTNETLSIPERNKSVKSIFCVQVRRPVSIETDSHAAFSNTHTATGATLQEFQFRVGGRYFPGRPVLCSQGIGSSKPNQGAESLFELQKALNTVGDYRLSSNVNALNWNTTRLYRPEQSEISDATIYLPEHDYRFGACSRTQDGTVIVIESEAAKGWAGSTDGDVYPDTRNYLGRATAGNVGSACFAAAVDLETSNGMEISGLNASEQSNIELMLKWSHAQSSGFAFIVFTYFDALLILKENNVVELIK